VTATRNKHVHFSAKLYEVATNRSAGIDMGVVDQLWRHCYFLRFSVINNKGNLLFADLFFYLITSISCAMELE